MENENQKETIETIEISPKDIADIYSLDNFINAINSKSINENTHRAEYIFDNNHHLEAHLNLAMIQKDLFMAPQVKYVLVYEK